ncbi:nolO [Symbiodinium pilosum]|uniref:NolO protein n=1 Tax=Symbiodinium pilosum TaxID=2952 RepID=A0A812JFX3_SYMPI|nr:nolO [Symbiodinium pilosum]
MAAYSCFVLLMLVMVGGSGKEPTWGKLGKVGFAIGRNSPGLIPRNRSHFVKDVRRAQRDYLKNYEAVSGLETSKTMGLLYEGGSAAEFALPTSLRADSGSVLALKFFGHDASIAVAKGGRIQCVLELERLFEIRYFSPSADSDDPAYTWFSALELVQKKCECEDGICPTSFDHGVLVNFGTRLGARWQVNFPKLVEEVFPVREWRNVNHHEAHAMLGYFASPFRSAFILSYDGGANDGESTAGQRAAAATIQSEFERLVTSKVHDFLTRLQTAEADVEGIVLTGGCALNVVANQLIRDHFTEAVSIQPDIRKPRDVYVPPAPNDSGLTVGAVWAVTPPTGPRQPLQYLGFRLWDLDILEQEARQRGALRLSELGGVVHLAELLAGGPAWQAETARRPREQIRFSKPIIAVVRGRQEFGPRALGHRSLLAVPDSEAMRDRMNRLKFRQWYRPVAPMIAEEALEEVFGHKYTSSYMEFAPKVLEEVRRRFPALAHFDGTARHQSVSRADEPWVHALLLAVGRWTGLAALMNTSFNSKGKPIVNSVKESLQMLDELADLDYVLIDDWLFRAPFLKEPGRLPDESNSVQASHVGPV